MADGIIYIHIADGLASIEEGAAAGDACDLPATIRAYEAEVCAILRTTYPGTGIWYQWESSNAGFRVRELRGNYNPDHYDEIVADIQRIAEDVWEAGNFWVPAE